MKECELFVEHFDADPDAVWGALKRAAAKMTLQDVDDTNRTARLSTGASLMSYSNYVVAAVVPAAPGADMVVRGRPKGATVAMQWSDDVHARGMQRNLREAVERELGG